MSRADGSYYADQIEYATRRYKKENGISDGDFKTNIPKFKKWLEKN
ncbi:MAG: hypothetical protein KAV87_35680 [Desulfobacteraceae bacterium]|nr:hypothetical protein [Desulfobacteraceae bacterium]